METLSPATDAAPFAPSITAWEAKERDGRLAHERPVWLSRRLEAENPDATAETLSQREFIGQIQQAWNSDFFFVREFTDLLAEAIASHPNTPPETLILLLNKRSHRDYNLRLPTRAICRNPVVPLLCREQRRRLPLP